MKPRLIQCIECGTKLSVKASACPKCQTKYPFGKQCLVCLKPVKTSEGVGSTDFGIMHPQCFANISKWKYSCSACGASIDAERVNACPNCNHPVVIDYCMYCNNSLSVDQAVVINENQSLYAHQACHSARHACFIATAAMGSPLAAEVLLLSEFRDKLLRRFALGRRLIHFYEQVSPPLATMISHSHASKVVVRTLLIKPASKISKRLLKLMSQ
ncbi:MAG: CFI-box-CTERM domain-containing protein [Cyanobacteriota bacterium]|nr:CFI-box-CTERM domain-containing protein [Cyanobacteriota bacterium]